MRCETKKNGETRNKMEKKMGRCDTRQKNGEMRSKMKNKAVYTAASVACGWAGAV